MATSGTYDYTLNLIDIIETAYERCGLPLQTLTAQDLRSARRDLDLLLLEWSNRQINFWTLARATFSTVAGQSEYILNPVDPIVDILDATITLSSNSTIPLNRITIDEWLRLPNKTHESKPYNFTIFREGDQVRMVLYPTPEDVYEITYFQLNYVQNAGNYLNNVNIPHRFLPSLILGLALAVGMRKAAEVPPEKLQLLKALYEQEFEAAREEDRERAPLYILPYIGHSTSGRRF